MSYFGEKNESIYFKIDDDTYEQMLAIVGKRGLSDFIRRAIEEQLQKIDGQIIMEKSILERGIGVKMTEEMKKDIENILPNKRLTSRFVRWCVNQMIKKELNK